MGKQRCLCLLSVCQCLSLLLFVDIVSLNREHFSYLALSSVWYDECTHFLSRIKSLSLHALNIKKCNKMFRILVWCRKNYNLFQILNLHLRGISSSFAVNNIQFLCFSQVVWEEFLTWMYSSFSGTWACILPYLTTVENNSMKYVSCAPWGSMDPPLQNHCLKSKIPSLHCIILHIVVSLGNMLTFGRMNGVSRCLEYVTYVILRHEVIIQFTCMFYWHNSLTDPVYHTI